MKIAGIIFIILLWFEVALLSFLVFFEKPKEQPKQPNPYFWYEIGIIKANEQISKSKYLTEYEKRKIWLQIDSARKVDSINISK